MLALHEAGYGVSIPFGENARYDLAIDDGIRLARVQCKTGRLRDGAITFKTSSSYAHHRTPRQNRLHYQGQIDFFGVYCRATRGTYLVPIEEVTTTCEAMLRVSPARNRQQKRIRLASDYELGSANMACVSPTRALHGSSGARGSSA